MIAVDLDGTWQAALADPERRRTFSAPEFEGGSGWHDVAVPGHWRSVPDLSDSDGPVLYRRRFDVDSLPSGERRSPRHWLVFDGIFYLGDVWLDGHYVGDTEGYFFPHQFEVSDLVESGTEHLLAVEVACPPQTDRTHKRNLTGSLQHSTWLDPDWNPGGIWRPVRIEETGPLRIRHARVRCVEANERRAVLAMRVVVDAAEPTTGTIRTTVDLAGPTAFGSGTDDQREQVLAAGENRVEWLITIDRPQLWWPHSLGTQPLYDVSIDVFDLATTDEAPSDAVPPSDSRRYRTGLRSIRFDRWITTVNDERLYLKGTNLGPTRQELAAAQPDEVVADLDAAIDLGMDLVRVHSHIGRPQLYGGADERGLLVWQDLPLQWAYARSVKNQALRQAREAVDLLAHHPSVAIWCGHNEPLPGGIDETGQDPHATRRSRLRRQMGQVLPSWNKNRLDPSIRRIIRTLDGTRPVIGGSGLLPQLPTLDGSDSHLWYGWEYGDVDDLGRAAVRWPRLVRFVSELGAQAVPASAEFCEPARWPDLDWDRLATAHGLRADLLGRIADPGEFESFVAWRDATQHYQARLLRRQIETLRLLKYRPNGGFAQFLLADAHPAVSHSLLDHRRRPKAAYEAVKAACAPVIVVARPSGSVGSRSHSVDFHLVSDRRDRLEGLELTAKIGARTLRWLGEIEPDSTSFVGSAELELVHEGTPGVLALEVLGPDGRTVATNGYQLGAGID